jgi:hypothetical protein
MAVQEMRLLAIARLGIWFVQKNPKEQDVTTQPQGKTKSKDSQHVFMT